MKLAIVGYQCLSPLHSPPRPPNFRSILHSITANLRSDFSAGLSQKLKFETLDCKLLFSLFLKNAFVVLLLCLNLKHPLNSSPLHIIQDYNWNCVDSLCPSLILLHDCWFSSSFSYIFYPLSHQNSSETCVSEDAPDS